MRAYRRKIKLYAEVHFPFPDNVVFEGYTGNISETGVKVNSLKHNPALNSEAGCETLVKIFFENGNHCHVVAMNCLLMRGHRTGFGLDFIPDANNSWPMLDRLIRKTLRDSVIKNGMDVNGWHFSKVA